MRGDNDTAESRSWARYGAIAALLAFIACNGLIVLAALLAGIGIGFDINPHLQAVLISLFGVLTAFFVFRGYRVHRNSWPLALAVVGAAVILATMYVYYSKLVESAALAALVIAAIWNWKLVRRGSPAQSAID